MDSSGYRLGISSGRYIITGREQESKYRFFFNFIRFYYLFILPSGGGSVPFVHPRKYAPVNIIMDIVSVIRSTFISSYVK